MPAERTRVEYGKLVRDRIPEMIASEGYVPEVRTLDADEYRAELDRKLREETEEFLESKSVEELADILEVIDALCVAYGHTHEEMHRIQKEKRAARGGFDLHAYLIAKR